MPQSPSYEPELEALIAEQEADQQGRYVFPERIVPRKAVLFSKASLREKACLALSFFMTRKEIAELLHITPASVTVYQYRARKKCSNSEIKKYRQIKSQK